MFSRSLLFALVVATTLLRAAPDKPNVVFFFADDQSAAMLGCYGNPIVQTPTIDSLAAKGIRFTNAFVSQPICWVSRTNILTGLSARRYGTPNDRDLATPDAVKTLYTDILSQNGYRTAQFGKWHARMSGDFKSLSDLKNISRIYPQFT